MPAPPVPTRGRERPQRELIGGLLCVGGYSLLWAAATACVGQGRGLVLRLVPSLFVVVAVLVLVGLAAIPLPYEATARARVRRRAMRWSKLATLATVWAFPVFAIILPALASSGSGEVDPLPLHAIRDSALGPIGFVAVTVGYRDVIAWQLADEEIAARLGAVIERGPLALQHWCRQRGCVGPGSPVGALGRSDAEIASARADDVSALDWRRPGNARIVAAQIGGYDVVIDLCDESPGLSPRVWLATVIDEPARRRLSAAHAGATLRWFGFEPCALPLALGARATARGRPVLSEPAQLERIESVVHSLVALAREAGLPAIGSVVAR